MRLGTNSMGTLGNRRATGMIGFSVFDADGGVRFCVLGVGSCAEIEGSSVSGWSFGLLLWRRVVDIRNANQE